MARVRGAEKTSPVVSALPPVLYAPRNWFEPLQWGEVFARPQPIEVDLGCGRGAFLAWAATNQPDTNFVGVDRLLVRLRKVAGKVQRAALSNVRLLRIEGSYFVRFLVPAATVTAYHILFPDPWPKRRHHDRRLFNEEFVSSLERTLVAGGVVNVATDDGDYATVIDQLLRARGGFTPESPPVIPAAGRTEFEQMFVEAGLIIHRQRWRKDRPVTSAGPAVNG